MLSPAWPAPERARRPATPAHIRRRVDAAQRRALRSAVSIGGAALVCLVALDAGISLVIRGHAASPVAQAQVAAMAVILVAAVFARRAIVRPEPLAGTILVVAYVLTFIGFAMDPTSEMLSVAKLVLIVVGSGLFLPWAAAWHAAWLLAALGGAVAFAALPIHPSIGAAERAAVVPIVLLAAATSLIGQNLLQGRLRRMVNQQFELRYLSRYSQRQEAIVRELNRELNHVARRDALTGVGNRLALDEALARLLDQGERLRPQRFALVLLDIDHFKAYNDEHGHLAGDAALDRLGEVLRRATRGNDLAFRYGGEEFVLLLPNVELPDAIAVAERIRVAVEEAADGGAPPFSISGGVALCDPADGRDPAPLLRRADAALYLAKRAGRNRIAADELSVAMQRERIASA